MKVSFFGAWAMCVVFGAAGLGCDSSFEPGASDTASASTANPTQTGPTSTGVGAGDATGGGAAGGGSPGAGGGADDRIDPISVGHAWTYDVTGIGALPRCPSGSHTGTVLSEGTVDGKDGFQISSLCATDPPAYYAVDGDVVEVDYQGTWLLALDAPVQEGHSWTNGVSSFTWHREGSVTVPAGKFDDCWRALQNDAGWDAYTIFCRGVGPIHWHSVDPTGDGYDAVMTGVNF